MKIEQSKVISVVLLTFTIVYIFGLLLTESSRGFVRQQLADPDFVTLEMIAFAVAIAALLVSWTVRSFQRVIIEPDRVTFVRIFSRLDFPEDKIAWISSGQGWLYLETITGKRYSFKILLGLRSLNSQAVEVLSQSVDTLKSKIQSRFPEQDSPVSLRGIFARMPIFFLLVVSIGLLPLCFSILNSTIDPTDAIIVAVIVPFAAALGLSFPIFMIGPLFAIELERNSISLKYLFRKVKLNLSDIQSNQEWYDEGRVTTNDGRIFRLGGLTIIGQEKLSLIGKKWYTK